MPAGRRQPGGAGRPPGARRTGVGQAVLPLRRAAVARRRRGRARRRPSRASTGATPAGGTSTPTTSSRCPTRGSTRGSRPGTSRFQTVAVAHIAPAFAKYQLLLMCREWFMHPNGALPAYEWSFDDVNPPVHAWAALEVFRIDGGQDYAFLERVFQKLLLNFTWWVNREDPEGNNVFEGGFLGLDNIGAVDRSHLPPGRAARPDRRHRLDGVLRADDAADRADAHREGRGLRGPRDQVLRALRDDHRGHQRQRAVGPGRRLLLRPARRRRTAAVRPCG